MVMFPLLPLDLPIQTEQREKHGFFSLIRDNGYWIEAVQVYRHERYICTGFLDYHGKTTYF